MQCSAPAEPTLTDSSEAVSQLGQTSARVGSATWRRCAALAGDSVADRCAGARDFSCSAVSQVPSQYRQDQTPPMPRSTEDMPSRQFGQRGELMWALTFDVRGGPFAGRPLDGGVRSGGRTPTAEVCIMALAVLGQEVQFAREEVPETRLQTLQYPQQRDSGSTN